MRRNYFGSRVQRPDYEGENTAKLQEAAEVGRAAELALREVLGSLAGDLTANEVALLAELEALGSEVARAKREIASLRVDDINASHIPTATDELGNEPWQHAQFLVCWHLGNLFILGRLMQC